MKIKLIIIGMSILTSSILSCKSTEKMNKEESSVQKSIAQVQDKVGYTSGTIVFSKAEGDCEYTIQTRDGLFYDPINMEDAYKKEGAVVWFTFRGLRMPNRCPKANPIELTEIQLAK